MEALLAVLGAFVLVVALYFAWRTASLRRNGVAVDGTVAGYEVTSSQGAGRSYCAVVDFQTTDGQTVRYVDKFPTSKQEWEVGSSVGMLYDPGSPKRAMIASHGKSTSAPIVVAVIGVVLLAAGIGSLTDTFDLPF